MKPKDGCPGKDVINLGPCLDSDGVRPFIRHRPDCSTETGFLKGAKEGEPLNSGAVVLTPREDGHYDVEDVFPHQQAAPTAEVSGPAKVNSKPFRAGWDRIFSSKQEVGQA